MFAQNNQRSKNLYLGFYKGFLLKINTGHAQNKEPTGISIGISRTINPAGISLWEFISGFLRELSIKKKYWIEKLDKLGIQSEHKALNPMTTQMNLCLMKHTQQHFHSKTMRIVQQTGQNIKKTGKTARKSVSELYRST